MATLQPINPWPTRPNHPLINWLYDVRSSACFEERIRNVVNLITSPPMNMSFIQFFMHIFSKNTNYSAIRKSFMKNKLEVGEFLNRLAEDPDGRKNFDDWLRTSKHAENLICEEVYKEMEATKSDMAFRTRDVTEESVMGFNFEKDIAEVLHTKAPTLAAVLLSAAQSKRAAAENTVKISDIICPIIFAQLCNNRSRLSLLFQQNMGLFLYATGTSRSVIDFLAHCGLSTSYQTVLKCHESLSNSLRKRAAEVARAPHMLGFDNEQISMSTHISQRPGAPPMVTSYTASVVYTLRNATLQSCGLAPILEKRKTCNIISFKKHIIPSRTEKSSIRKHITQDIIEILFKNTEGFESEDYQKLIEHEKHRPPPQDHKTTKCVNPTVEFDEAKTSGVLSFIENLYLEIFKISEGQLGDLAIPTVNDQLTNSRIRTAQIERRDDESAFLCMDNFQVGIGFFHVLMNLLWQIRATHKGSDDVPGSLSFWWKTLGTKRVGGERPDYYTLRTFLLDVLYANILHCWSKKTGCANLEDYAKKKPSPDELLSIAGQITDEFASDKAMESCGDNLLSNVILLNRDLLIFYELDAAISSGDFGRIEQLFGILARMFSGAGAKNYALEFLHLIQNLKLAWPEDFANVMRDNMLISVKGHPGHYMGVDLNMEHNVNFQKRFFAGKGVHGTSRHLERLSPVTQLYRPLRLMFCSIGRIPWQGSSHTHPNRLSTIKKVQSKLKESHVYETQSRKAFKLKVEETKDILKDGGKKLRTTGMKNFEKIYRDWATKRTGTVQGEKDEPSAVPSYRSLDAEDEEDDDDEELVL